MGLEPTETGGYMRTVLLSMLLVAFGQAHGEEVYTGKLPERNGLFYKPLQIELFSGSYLRWYENSQLAAERTYKNGKQYQGIDIWGMASLVSRL